jgi:hypothetical protein
VVSPLDRAREVALAELRAAPVARPWRTQAARHAALTAGLTAAIAGAAALLGIWRTPSPVRVAAMALLLVGQALSAWAAWAPPRRARVVAPAVVLAAAAALLVLARGAGEPSSLPEWVCSLTHLGIDVVPMALALRALRQGAWYGGKSVMAVVGVGATGALLGELACPGDVGHLVLHHFGAWLVAGLAAWALARRADRSPAP